MKEEINIFVDEITTNFTELFVETFFIRFLSDFGNQELTKSLKNAGEVLCKKISKKINNKITNLNERN